MNVDTRSGTVSYIIDGTDFGPAFTDQRFRGPAYVCCQSWVPS